MAPIIREISIKDVEDFIYLLSKIHEESKFTSYDPGEYSPTIQSASDYLEHFITSPTNTIFVAENDEQLVGFALITTKNYERTKHEAIISMGVKYLYRSKGIGSSLIHSVEAWCLNRKIRRIEACIVPENQHALELFKSSGFNIEGELRDKLLIDGKYYNQYILSKLLN